MPGGPRQDLAHALTADVRVHLRRWLDLFARYDFIHSTSDQPNGRYQLDEVVTGVALAWVLHNPHVTSSIVGPRTIEHLDASVKALDVNLDEDAMAALDEMFPGPGGEAPEAYAW